MGFKPNTTVYLCAGTGMDYGNSIWWHRHAYPKRADPSVIENWWNSCFAFFKAHSIAKGYWFCSYVSPDKGYFTVGRNTLYNTSYDPGEDGEASLGRADKQAQIDDPRIPYSETLNAIDYIIFNNDDADNQHVSDAKYAFVDRVVYVNQNVARVYFTIDAIMTYQKYFFLGRTMVAQDMEYGEWVSGKPNQQIDTNHFNTAPETIPFISDDDYVMEEIASGNSDKSSGTYDKFKYEEYMSLGAYTGLFCTSDVSLSENDIKPSIYNGALPAFEPSISSWATNQGPVLGIGLYFISSRKNPAFTALGSFNAMEHILSSYLVPAKLLNEIYQSKINPQATSGDCEFILSAENVINRQYKGDSNLGVEITNIPITVDDEGTDTSGTELSGFMPLNVKTYTAPFMYLSLTDYMGSSVEILPQDLIDCKQSGFNLFSVKLKIEPSIAPNVASIAYVENTVKLEGSIRDPLFTLWQIPSYVMTPNASGYNNYLLSAAVSRHTMKKQFLYGIAWHTVGVAAQNAAGMVGSTADKGISLGGQLGGMAAGAAAVASGGTTLPLSAAMSVGGMLGDMSTPNTSFGSLGRELFNPITQVGSGLIGAGVSSWNAALNNEQMASALQAIGLPKALGGLPSGLSTLNANNARYGLYFCHLRARLIKDIDWMFTRYGYHQNKWRYPHINTRKRWCYVKLGEVNIVPLQANEYDSAGIPYAFRAQIEARLQAGVTFWNVRYALMGDADSDTCDSTVTQWNDAKITAIKNCQFVRNYGDYKDDQQVVLQNRDGDGGYAANYTDDVNVTVED